MHLRNDLGETSRAINVRINEHKRDVRRKFPEGAVGKHMKESQGCHRINTTRIVEREPREFHRKAKEHLWILKSGKKSMNKDSGRKLSPIWPPVLLRFLDEK